jgi:hypothetical protein
MFLFIAYAAAIGCSFCNGISTVQQKIGADKEKIIHSFDFMFLLRLLRNFQYSFGTALEILAYLLSLVALRILPLFLVQSLIAASIVVTAFGERLILHRRLTRRTLWMLGTVLAGLVLLAVSAVTGHANDSNYSAKILVEILPLPIAVAGLFFIHWRHILSAFFLAALGGLAFGNTSTIGRILVYPHPFWKIIENPLLASLILSAILGQYLFTASLQRSTATKSNAIMIALQTLGPAFMGLLFFDDRIKAGFAPVVIIGTLLVVIGSAFTAVAESPAATI